MVQPTNNVYNEQKLDPGSGCAEYEAAKFDDKILCKRQIICKSKSNIF